MTPNEKLHAHHAKLIGTIRALAERTKDDPAEASLLLSYCNEYLVSHAEAEEATLYTADDDKDFVNGMIHEHEEIKHSLEVIDASFSRGDSNGLFAELENFMKVLDRHFHEEENTLMPRLNGKFSEHELELMITDAHRIEAEKKKADVWSLFEYDHKRIDLNISRLRGTKGDITAMEALYSKMRAQLLKHIELEETVLFTTFGEHASSEQMGPVRVMIAEHREITSYISTPADRVNEKTLRRNIGELVARLAVHNKKEELILYPLINRTIPRGEKDKVFKECFEELSKV